jgi:UDP-N-acetylglucosamine 2-epimerase (non-hydrolysing)
VTDNRLAVSIVGTRPNFVKVLPVERAMSARGIRHIIVHTGQHFDPEMFRDFTASLGMRLPDVNLEIGGVSQEEQVARILQALPPVLSALAPQWVIVYGDVTSTLAGALAARYSGLPVAHVESGFRSFDRTMPEEINRVLVDHLSDICLAPADLAAENLSREGVPAERVRTVGSTAIDILVQTMATLDPERGPVAAGDSSAARADSEPYAVMTLHRPGNVDDNERLIELIEAAARVSRIVPVRFPVHPRTADRIRSAGITLPPAIQISKPLGYRKFLIAIRDARLVITDSGGLQEETAYLGVPALIMRSNTERPYLLSRSMRLIGADPSEIVRHAEELLELKKPTPFRDQWMDGRASERVVEALFA